MKITLDIDLEKFRYSLVGDGYLKEEVEEMSSVKLIKIFRDRIYQQIETKYDKSRRYGLIY